MIECVSDRNVIIVNYLTNSHAHYTNFDSVREWDFVQLLYVCYIFTIENAQNSNLLWWIEVLPSTTIDNQSGCLLLQQYSNNL